MKHIKTKEELITELVKLGVSGIDKPWEEMSMDAKARYAIYIDHNRAKDVDVAQITRMDDRVSFISEFPTAANRYDINKFDDYALSMAIISKHPSLLKKLNKDRIAKLQWGSILPYQPQFARYCDFSALSADDWAAILDKQPQFLDRFDPTRFKSAFEWCQILRYCPALWRKCPFEGFSRDDKLKVASASVHLLKKLDIKSFERRDWFAIMGCVDPEHEPVNVWIASELKRLSSQLKLPK